MARGMSAILHSCITRVVLATVFLASNASYGEPLTQYAHTAWRVQDGAFGASPVSIAQTADGFLWIGTRDGLIRFDGVRFESWDDRLREIQRGSAISLLGASDGALWIGTGAGLAKLKGGKLSAVTDRDARYDEIIEDRKGRIWLGRTRIRDDRGPLCEFEGGQVLCHGHHDGLNCQFAGALVEDRGGTIWIGDQGKVCSWKDGAAAAYSAPAADHGCKPLIESLLADADRSILIACDAGVRRLDQGTIVPFDLASLDAGKLRGAKLLHDRGGGLWLGTRDEGLYHVDNGAVDHFGVADGLSDSSVSALYEDREGNVWVATPNGLDRFHRLRVVSYSGQQGFHGLGEAVLASRDGHTIWTAGPEGLAAIRDGKITMISSKDGLPGQQATGLFEDARGVLWVGVDEDLFSYANGRFSRKVRSDGKPTGMVIGMTEDAGGNIWIVIAGKDRLLRLDPRTEVAEVVAKRQAPSRIARSSNGKVYLSSFLEGEISILRRGDVWEGIPVPTGPRTVYGLLPYGEDALFVATTRGLYRWADQKWSALTANNGLPCEAVQDLINDDQGNLWLHLACGYVYIGKAELDAWARDAAVHLDLKLYDVWDGARAGRGSFEPLHARTADGRLWFANGLMLQMIDPRNLPRNQLTPPVHILSMVADHKSVDIATSVGLPALTRDLEFHYAALSLVSSEKVRYRYRVSDIDQDWHEAGPRREAYYMGLPPGRYRFQVIGSNNDGVWSPQGAALDFSIAPAYYQTSWFRALCAVLLLVLLWAGYQLRVRRLRRQFEMTLDARVAERTRIARELHDTLLQSFHGLLLRFQTALSLLPGRPGEARNILASAIDQAAEAITEGRDAVQGLRASTTETNDLANAFRALGEHLTNGNGNEASLRVDVQGVPRDLHPIVRDEVFRIGSEALRNAYRHGGAKQIEVELRYAEGELRLRVRDDGKGIDTEVLHKEGREGHFGLHGMRERAKLAGGKLTIWSGPDAGTEIELSIPAAHAYVKDSPPQSKAAEKTIGQRDLENS
jgi:signal transduction histidine kinase/ligand-binding sensor domain-containing protein